VTRVVRLLSEMREQVEAEAKEDESIYSKMACWCKTNDREKTSAIKEAERRIEDLSAAVEEGTARGARLSSEISGLKDDIQANQDSLDKAAALREKEKGEYEEQSQDLTESIGALREAVAVLAKVQLLQGRGGREKAAASALLQVRELVAKASRTSAVLEAAGGGVYRSVMQKDLWDLLSAIPAGDSSDSGRVITGLEQQPTGAAAGATSYGARSTSIFGMLKQMQETFEKDLASAQRAEMEAEIAFQKLRSAKEGELQASGKSAEEKSSELADTNAEVAQAKADADDTRGALSADEKFLMDLKERCATADSAYAERSQTRQDEVQAISEAIQILTEDDARDLFSKTTSFLQTSSHGRHRRGASQAAGRGRQLQRLVGREQQQQRVQAASQLMAAARRHAGNSGGLRLATLAVGVQLDGFEKVKEVMDNMVAELKKQQKEEYEKHESCQKDIDANEDDTRVKETEKKDLESNLAGLEGRLEGLTKEVDELNANVAKAHVALKSASEQRQAENHEFQQVVADQRATVGILQKALTRLRAFYAAKPATALLSVAKRRRRQEPGADSPPPPPSGKAYSKAGASAGVLQMMEKIIQDAEKADQEAVAAEQASQNSYTELVSNVNAELDAMSKAIAEKTIAKEKAEADKLTAGNDLRATEAELTNLAGQSQALHLNCDYLLKYFTVRQQARREEVEAIKEAKAILSGADFAGEE